MIRLIGISGKKGSGKNTVASMIQAFDQQDGTCSPFLQKSFAEKLKRVCALLTGTEGFVWDNEEFKKTTCKIKVPGGYISNRHLLQFVGTDLFRNQLSTDIWIQALFADYCRNDKWIITDVRFPNEADEIRSRCGIIFRVDRPTSEEDTHESETAMDNYQVDYVIDNDKGLDELAKQVHIFYKHLF